MEKFRDWLIRTFGLKGSWSWAKKQMMKGKMVRCRHWEGSLKYRCSIKTETNLIGEENPSTLLQANYTRTNNPKYLAGDLWESKIHYHISYEDFTDYEVFEWPDKD